MGSYPLVSIIIPTYNMAEYISQTLESIIKQSYSNWECLIIDDGSTDRTAEVVTSFQKKYKNFFYYKQKNQGVNTARNLGITKSKGRLIQFLDADDLLQEKKIECQVKILSAHPSIDIVYTRVQFFTESEGNVKIAQNIHKPRSSGRGLDILKVITANNITAIHSPLARKEVFDQVGLFDESLTHMEDWEFWWRCALADLSFAYHYSENAAALYRKRPESASTDSFQMIYGEGVLRNKIHHQLPPNLRSYNRIKLAHVLFNLRSLLSETYDEKKRSSLFYKLFLRSPLESKLRFFKLILSKLFS
jgi:glycosyltransferase involved in cell wall biosynthesis